MKSTNTFGVQFVARNSKLSSLDLLIYARITVNSKRIEISLKKTVHSSYWDAKAGRVKGNKDLMRQVNPYIEDVRFKLIECYRELQLWPLWICPASKIPSSLNNANLVK